MPCRPSVPVLRYILFEGEDNAIPLEENFERWIVAGDEAEARQRALAKFPGEPSLKLLQDEDVLDTWFARAASLNVFL